MHGRVSDVVCLPLTSHWTRRMRVTINADAQFYVLREKGTEPAGSGIYDKFFPDPGEGYFACAGCGSPLYSAASKFDSGCGWPAFDKCFEGSVKVCAPRTRPAAARAVGLLCALRAAQESKVRAHRAYALAAQQAMPASPH